MKELKPEKIKELSEVLSGEIIFPDEGTKELPALQKLVYDSRLAGAASAFFCLPGEKTDGNQFVNSAITAGAEIVVSSSRHQNLSVPQILVSDVRLALAKFASALYENPSSKLRLIGVTGTNGKTTSTHLIEQILGASGGKSALIGTLGSRIFGQGAYQDAKHTTPQAPELQELLASMLERGCSHVAMEVSSHALALKRVAELEFAVACLSNISQDHLDFHKTMEHYWRSKRILFEMLNESRQDRRLALVNYDDPLSGRFLEILSPGIKKLSYGFSDKAQVYVLEQSYKQGRTNLCLETPWGRLNISMKLVGSFNIYNVMLAASVCLNEGVEIGQIEDCLSDFAGVPGRFESVALEKPSGKEPLCIVDYAHTPDGLDNVLKTASDMKVPGGRLICVFGCGGDRDPSKRPQMGEIAEARADLVIVSSDNPRSEDPQAIIANILAGIKRIKSVVVEADRAKAIALAVKNAGPKDIVLVAGKGHENYQLVKDRVLPFDDKVELARALEALQAQEVS